MILTKYTPVGGSDFISPAAGVTDTLGEAEHQFGWVNSPAGAYDPNGNDELEDRAHTITRVCEFVDTTPTALQTHLDAARALRGTKGTLTATTGSGGTRTLIGARCRAIRENRTGRNFAFQGLTFVFDISRSRWRGTDHSNSTTLTTSSVTAATNNGGNAKVYDAILTIAPAGSNITGINIKNTTNNLVELVWSGTIVVGNQLVISCGDFSILNNNVDAYSGLSFGAAHHIGEWMQLDPGNNNIVVARTGGGATSAIVIAFADRWK